MTPEQKLKEAIEEVADSVGQLRGVAKWAADNGGDRTSIFAMRSLATTRLSKLRRAYKNLKGGA